MAHFVIHNKEGNIINVGNCPDGEEQNQKFNDEHEILIGVQAQAHHKVDVTTKKIIECDIPPRVIPKHITSEMSDERLRAMIYRVLQEAGVIK